MIDVQKGELRLRVQEEEVTFNVFNAIKHPHDTDSLPSGYARGYSV